MVRSSMVRSSLVTLLPLAYAQDIFVVDDATCSSSFEVDTDYHNGQGLGHAPATSASDCCTQCSKFDGCTYFTFAPDNTCWFKDNNGGKRSYKGAISGGVATPPAPPAPPAPPPAVIDRLEKAYSSRMQDSCGKALASLPSISAEEAASFMTAYRSFTGADGQTEDAIFAEASKLLSRKDVDAFLSAKDSFSSGGLDALLVECVVLTQATPKGLAEYAAQGDAEESLVGKLLQNAELMRDMLVAGGARDGKYGEAMDIYERILSASEALQTQQTPSMAFLSSSPLWDDREQKSVLGRCALGTALENAVPQKYRWAQDPAVIDPVERYMHYENAYKAGELDPHFEVLTAFECRYTTNSKAKNEELSWMRETTANYRPDHIVSSDMNWRYARTVRTEVAYGHSEWLSNPPNFTQIPAAGGECGARAWFGRFSRNSFGLPTWGVQQPGHAALTTWTPKGWTVLLGAGPESSYWENRGGPDFFLETQVREYRPDFQKVLRGQWAAQALGEEPVDPQWGRGSNHYGKGDTWSALMLYSKKTVMQQGAAPERELGTSVVPTKVEKLIEQWSKKFPKPPITTGKDGTITIPAASFISAKNSVLMNSADDGQQLLHNGGDYVHPETSYFHYEVEAESDGTYFLTANFTTWHINQDLFVTTNTTTELQNVSVFYTSGYWRETQPLMIDLVKGRNVLTFSRWTNRPLVFKEFFLFKTRPDIPIPDPARTPAPSPAPVPLDSIIELPLGKTCESQGILELSEEDCGLAAEYLGHKYTGARQRAWFPGCFCMGPTSQWAGNCNYNSNRSGTGMDDENAAIAVCQRA